MQITINQTEIEIAILAHMRKLININEGASVTIEMKATRGSEGFSAIVDIADGTGEQAHIQEAEKVRVTKAKEAKFEEADRFLKETVKNAKIVDDLPEESEPEETATKPEPEAEETTESDSNTVAPVKKKNIFAAKLKT